jgi:hypothetical protein
MNIEELHLSKLRIEKYIRKMIYFFQLLNFLLFVSYLAVLFCIVFSGNLLKALTIVLIVIISLMTAKYYLFSYCITSERKRVLKIQNMIYDHYKLRSEQSKYPKSDKGK